MKILYDFHIHSCLSPCADNDMTPMNIAAMASIKGLTAIAVSDHNSIKNVQAAMNCGKDFGVVIIPAVEIQTSEDIHILALFYDIESLIECINKLEFIEIKNKEHIFGKQLIVNEDDEIIKCEQNLLLTSAKQNVYEVVGIIKKYNGLAIPAHIDREQNGIIAILGDIPSDLQIDALELSKTADVGIKKRYNKNIELYNSDAHKLEDIGSSADKSYIIADRVSIKEILNAVKEGRICNN